MQGKESFLWSRIVMEKKLMPKADKHQHKKLSILLIKYILNVIIICIYIFIYMYIYIYSVHFVVTLSDTQYPRDIISSCLGHEVKHERITDTCSSLKRSLFQREKGNSLFSDVSLNQIQNHLVS
jgi:hypothetical protein